LFYPIFWDIYPYIYSIIQKGNFEIEKKKRIKKSKPPSISTSEAHPTLSVLYFFDAWA
jgi:hypothetical protein